MPNTPPHLADRLLRVLCAPHLQEEVLGDLHERYVLRVKRLGKQKAKIRYWLDVSAYLRPAFIKRQTTPEKMGPMPTQWIHSYDDHFNQTTTTMLGTYIKIAFRSLSKNQRYSAINISGLAVGLACAIMLFLVIKHETSYDTYQTNSGRIYRVETENIQEKHTYPGTYTGMANALLTDVPEAELVVPLFKVNGSTFAEPTSDKRFKESFVFADNRLFQLLDYQWLSGNSQIALSLPNSVVLSRAYAEKYFGTTDVLGKTIRFDNKQDLQVVGVLENHTKRTSFPFDILVSLPTLKTTNPDFDLNKWNGWGDNFQVYIRLKAGLQATQLKPRFSAIIAKYIGKEALPDKNFVLNPLSKLHYEPNLSGRSANSELLKMLSLIGVFVLLIACFNFINLATAQAFKRAKEVGIRKAVGSNRQSLVYQFLTEAGLITGISILLAILLTQLALPTTANVMNIPLTTGDLYTWQTGLFLIGLVLITTLLAGLYPAFRLSGMAPIWALKNNTLPQVKQGFTLRQGLVVAQFTVSLILIGCTLLINQQLAFLKNADLGFNKAAIITIGLPDNSLSKLQSLRGQLLESSQIKDVSFSFNSASAESNWMQNMEYRKEAQPTIIKTQMKMGDAHFLDTYGIQLVAGASLRDSDTSSASFKVIANEVFINRLGISRPEAAIGQKVYYGDGQEWATIVGIVRNFNVNSLHQQIDPTLFQVVPKNFYQAGIKLKNDQFSSESVQAALSTIEEAWITTFPNQVFDYKFLDESLEAAYKSETRTAQLIEVSMILAILIACLGLFGLATFTAEQRTKEIGVRKVLGASVASIILLLCRDFLKPVLIAIGIASPIAWWVMGKWLQNFAFKIEIHWWVFALTGAFMTLIALVTVSSQSIKAALVNPIKSLHSE
ncbi:ABC transporter permease [Spirosoma daeguense]